MTHYQESIQSDTNAKYEPIKRKYIAANKRGHDMPKLGCERCEWTARHPVVAFARLSRTAFSLLPKPPPLLRTRGFPPKG